MPLVSMKKNAGFNLRRRSFGFRCRHICITCLQHIDTSVEAFQETSYAFELLPVRLFFLFITYKESGKIRVWGQFGVQCEMTINPIFVTNYLQS